MRAAIGTVSKLIEKLQRNAEFIIGFTFHLGSKNHQEEEEKRHGYCFIPGYQEKVKQVLCSIGVLPIVGFIKA